MYQHNEKKRAILLYKNAKYCDNSIANKAIRYLNARAFCGETIFAMIITLKMHVCLEYFILFYFIVIMSRCNINHTGYETIMGPIQIKSQNAYI